MRVACGDVITRIEAPVNESAKFGKTVSSPSSIRIRLNGEEREAPAGATVASLVRELGLQPDEVAVELDRRIVRRADWDRTELRPGASVEMVHFVGGG